MHVIFRGNMDYYRRSDDISTISTIREEDGDFCCPINSVGISFTELPDKPFFPRQVSFSDHNTATNQP